MPPTAEGGWPGFPTSLLELARAELRRIGFQASRQLLRGYLFERPDGTAVILDHAITDQRYFFDYNQYSEEQNHLAYQHRALYRFVVDDRDDLTTALTALTDLLGKQFESRDAFVANAAERELTAIDPTLPEAYFEQAFIDVFGREKLDCLAREYPILDISGRNRFVDYFLETDTGTIAIEKNGESYHHPLCIGRARYDQQLLKQNSLVAYGAKVYRWSLAGMQFKERFYDELRRFFGSPAGFRSSRKVSVTRTVRSLYPHQNEVLATIARQRDDGQDACLVVLPTGTGKSEVLVADYARMCQESGGALKGLVLVPSLALRSQLTETFRSRLGSYWETSTEWRVGEHTDAQVVVQTYAWMARHLHEFDSDQFSYIAVDEAHHAVAPVLKKVIRRFNPKFLLGLTATDQRLDSQKLEDVFGKYDVELSLSEAIRQGLLAPLRAFRLVSNLDLSEVRFNGRDYVNADLERTISVPSRNQLIVDLLKKYFVDSQLPFKSGIIFCVSVKQAQRIAQLLVEQGVSAAAVSGSDRGSASQVAAYQRGKIQFLATCSLLNEGWDSPRTSVIVMARPTMSKVLYTQQLGRGTRKWPGKEALYVIDVVDNYGPLGQLKNTPWSVHALLGQSSYRPWAEVLDPQRFTGAEELVLAGLYEHERALVEIDIFTFEAKYPDHLSEEQMARQLFISTDTLRGWVRKGLVEPAVSLPFGRRQLHYFAESQIAEIRAARGLKVRDETTRYDDFFEFLEERDYALSYKMVMMLALLDLVDGQGECELSALVRQYAAFYRQRLQEGLPVDRPSCKFTLENLEDDAYVQDNLLRNPFEKFERKRFLYHCQDLNRVAFEPNLWARLTAGDDLKRIRKQMEEDLQSYYAGLKQS